VGKPWDVAHLHNLHGRYFDLAALPELAAVAPTIVTMHDMWLLTGHCAQAFSCQRWRNRCGTCPDLSIYPAVRLDFTRRNLARKRRFLPQEGVAISSPGRWLLDLVGESYLSGLPRRYMPNTVDTTVFSPGDQLAARRRLGLPEGVPIALFPAQLTSPPSAFKGQDTFLAVLRRLAPEGVQGLAFGDAAVAADLQRVLRVLPATFDEGRLADGYRAADIVVLPSRAETFGLGVLEAMACARPVVATRVGGIPELVEEGTTGDLVAVGDTDGLAGACRRLFASPDLRAAYGAAGREAAQPFELGVVADAWLEFYASLVEARARRSAK
jgi:glycosyltransferase involved in cell wall biosynthesis